MHGHLNVKWTNLPLQDLFNDIADKDFSTYVGFRFFGMYKYKCEHASYKFKSCWLRAEGISSFVLPKQFHVQKYRPS